MTANMLDILVIGAGMAGLTCANKLADAGRAVSVIDKGRGPGGRMASRRAEIAGDVVGFDHGAQYFTARDEAFRKAVDHWVDLGVVARWPAAGEDAWVGMPGMNGPIRAMAAARDVRWSTCALSLKRTEAAWHVDIGDCAIVARTVLVAIPAEQAHALLTDAAPELAAIAGAVRSEPCWAVMASFAAPLDLPDVIRAQDAAIGWAARNSAKPGRKGVESWVIHASASRSRSLLNMAKDEVGPTLLRDFFDQSGTTPTAPIHLVAHRWLYAMPGALGGERAYYDAKERIGIAGDYLHSPRVEGAWLSGAALGEQVLRAG